MSSTPDAGQHLRLSQRRAEALAEAVKTARTDRGLSQSELATMCRLTKTHIQRIEWATANPTLATAYAIADGLGISFNQLFASQAPANERGKRGRAK